MKQLKKTILTLVALLALTTQAWAKWNGGTYTATDNEKIYITVNVSDDATLTINQGFTVTTESITISDGKTLTVVGPGSLVVKEGITGSGTIIVKGNASLLVYGAEGSDGASGDNGSDGGDGAAAIMCSITIYSGSILAYGGDGGKGGDGDLMSGSGGDGGNAGPAFGGSGTLTYYGGSIEAFRGSLGAGGEGASYGEFGEDATAFADTYNVVFENQPTSIQDAYDNPIDINDIKGVGDIKILGDDADAVTGPTPVDIAWDKTTKTGTFTQPAGNVTVSVEYFPQAALTEAPTAINDVPATTDGAIVKVGTVANIGSTETAQGTVMYYVSTTALDDDALLALDADAWKADVPTAESLAEGQAYVYYYVRGNDSDTDEENFSDGDINALAVTIAAEPTYAVTFADGVNPEPPAEPEWTATPNTDVKKGQTVTVTYTGDRKVIGVKAEKKAAAPAYPMASEATAADYGKVVCAAGHLHDAKTAVPEGCTAVAVFAYIDGGNKRMGIALQDAENATWNMITTDGAYNNTLCAVPGTWNVAAPTDAEWFVGTKEIYEAIFTNLGSTTSHVNGKSYDDNVNAFITTGVGGTALSDDYWCTTSKTTSLGWKFSGIWSSQNKTNTNNVRPVLGF